MSKEIGVRLANLRKNAGLTQDELANRLNKKYNRKLSKITISKIENGERNLSQKMSKIYSEFFNVSLDWIMGISNNNLLDAYMSKSTLNKGIIKEIKTFLFNLIIKQQEKVYELIKENNIALDFDNFTVDSDFEDFIIYSDLLDLDISNYNPDLLELLDLMSEDILIQYKQKKLLKLTTKIHNIKDIEELIKIAEIKLLNS